MRNPNVKIRIKGEPEIVQEVVNGMRVDDTRFYKSVSRPYLNRNDGDVRVYVTITAAAGSRKYNRREIGSEDTGSN